MPTEFYFYLIVGGSLALMAFSAFYLKDESPTTRGFARAGLVVGGGTLVACALVFASLIVAAFLIMLPAAAIWLWLSGGF